MERVTKNKMEGGLGITDVLAWNRGAYCRLIFKLLTDRESVWSSWMLEYRLKGKHFWSMSTPKNCSWIQRGILKHRKYAKHLIHYFVTNRRYTSLWHDLWCGPCPLAEDEYAKTSLGLPANAKVEALISGGKWNHLVTGLSESEL